MQASLPKKNSKYTSHMLTLTQKTVLAYLWGRVTVQNWRLVWRCMPRSPARVHALSFVVMWTVWGMLRLIREGQPESPRLDFGQFVLCGFAPCITVILPGYFPMCPPYTVLSIWRQKYCKSSLEPRLAKEQTDTCIIPQNEFRYPDFITKFHFHASTLFVSYF